MANVFSSGSINPTGQLEIRAEPSGTNCIMENAAWGPSQSSCVLPPLPVGAHTLTAKYLGDGAYAGSQVSQTLNVVKPQGTLSFQNASPGGANLGQPITVRVQLSVPYQFEATGTVRIIANSALDTGCTMQLPQTECTIRVGRVGQVPFLLDYLGDANYGPVNGAPFNVTGFATSQATVQIEIISRTPAGIRGTGMALAQQQGI